MISIFVKDKCFHKNFNSIIKPIKTIIIVYGE